MTRGARPSGPTTAASSASAAFRNPPPHLLLKDAFGQEMASRLLAFVVAREADFSDSSVGQGSALDRRVRRSRRLNDFGDLRQDLEAGFGAALPTALAALGLAPFALAGLSLEVAAHGDGDFYRRHIDTFVGGERASADRAVTAVYYFHAEPKAFTGGELRLFSPLPMEEGGAYIDMEPLNDALLLFPAWVPHEVRPVSCPGGGFAQSRFAINCWYKRQPA